MDNNHATSYVHVPRQIFRDELVKLLPETWVTNYEKLHKDVHLVQFTKPKFTKKKDGCMVIKIDCMEQKTKVFSSIFSTLLMVQPGQDDQEDGEDGPSHKLQTGLPVHSFNPPCNR